VSSLNSSEGTVAPRAFELAVRRARLRALWRCYANGFVSGPAQRSLGWWYRRTGLWPFYILRRGSTPEDMSSQASPGCCPTALSEPAAALPR